MINRVLGRGAAPEADCPASWGCTLPFFKAGGLLLQVLAVWILISPVFVAEAGAETDGASAGGLPDCIVRYEKGFVNWTTGEVVALGHAQPEDRREISIESLPGAARADANSRIISVLKQVRIHGTRTVGQYASDNDIILAGIEKTARDAVVTRQHYTSALSIEIRLAASLYGGFLQLVLPEQIRGIPRIRPFTASPDTPEGYSRFTGLIIDARGLGVVPELMPRILSEQGHEVYSPVFISREFAVQNGVCRYALSLERARQIQRLGAAPLVIKGLRKEGSGHSAVVISMLDYHTLEKVVERHGFFRECRVALVID